MRKGQHGEIILSERNLLALLHKLQMEGSARTIYKQLPTGEMLAVRAEKDQDHYGSSPHGRMHPDTEEFIEKHQKGGNG